MENTRFCLYYGLCFVALISQASASTALEPVLPALEPLLNVLLPTLNTVYNLILNIFSSLDSIPPHLAAQLPVDTNSVKFSLTHLYLGALDLVKYLVGLPKDDPKGENAFKHLKKDLDKLLKKVDDVDTNRLDVELLDGVLDMVHNIVDALLEVLP